MSKSKRPKQPGTGLVLKGHTATVIGVAVTPEGKRVVSGSHDSYLRVWTPAGVSPAWKVIRIWCLAWR
jgi:WD40 repeat protein